MSERYSYKAGDLVQLTDHAMHKVMVRYGFRFLRTSTIEGSVVVFGVACQRFRSGTWVRITVFNRVIEIGVFYDLVVYDGGGVFVK